MNITETFKHMALNDEEKSIHLSLCFSVSTPPASSSSSHSNLNDDAGNITETFKHMALNDEEKPIDLEVAAELAFKAWVRQYYLDHEACVQEFQKVWEGKEVWGGLGKRGQG